MFSALLVEDNIAFREVLSNLLLSHFPAMNVEESGDGEDALEKLRVISPDIVFMDIRLPKENGLEIARRIRQDHAQVVIVILTGHDHPEYRQRALSNGADAFISKGSDDCMENVLAHIEALIDGKRH